MSVGLAVSTAGDVEPEGQAEQAEVGGLAQCVLRGIDSAHLHVELAAAIATGDDDGLAHEVAKGFKHLLAQLLQHWYVLRRYAVVDAAMRGR